MTAPCPIWNMNGTEMSVKFMNCIFCFLQWLFCSTDEPLSPVRKKFLAQNIFSQAVLVLPTRSWKISTCVVCHLSA